MNLRAVLALTKVVLGIFVLQYHAFHLWERLAPTLVAVGLGLALELGALDLIARRGKRRLLGWVLAFALAVGAAGGAFSLYGQEVNAWIAARESHRIEQTLDHDGLIAIERKNLGIARENSRSRAGWLGAMERATENIQALEQAKARAQAKAPAFPFELGLLLGAALVAMVAIQLLTGEAAQELGTLWWQKQARESRQTTPSQIVRQGSKPLSTDQQKIINLQQQVRQQAHRISWTKLATLLRVNPRDLSLLNHHQKHLLAAERTISPQALEQIEKALAALENESEGAGQLAFAS